MDQKVKQKTLRLLSNGMYVMTSRSGERVGAATITWLSQASFNPPLIMAAVRQDSNVFECLSESRIVAIHILGEDQQNLARNFLSTTKSNEGTINGEPFIEGKTTAPILHNTPAHVECNVKQIIDAGGDHALVVMEVIEAEFRREVEPLIIGKTHWHYGG